MEKEKYYNKYYQGRFWLPEYKEHIISATLFIDEFGTATISTLDSITADNVKNRISREDNMLIVGHISLHNNSDIFTVKLYNSFYTRVSNNSYLSKFEYQSDKVYISEHDENVCCNCYKEILLKSDLLNDFVQYIGIKTKTNKGFTVGEVTDTIEYKPNPIINLYKSNDFDIRLLSELHINNKSKRSVNINENITINVRFTESQDIDELASVKESISRLFSILLNSTSFFQGFNVMTENNSWYKGLVIKENIDSSFIKSAKPIDYIYFETNSQQIFENWFSKQDKLELFLKNFFKVYKRIGVLPENRFATYLSILENYFTINKSINKNIAKEIINNYYDKEVKKGVKKITNMTNILIFFIHRSSISKSISDIKNYAIKLKISRAYYVHLEETHKENSYTREELVNENFRLEYLILEVLYSELGITLPEYVHKNYNVRIDEI